ncbi:UL16-binding protein 1-like [Peromyscus californicus insignis]|uniref:UL16-binding protein 1-like n=1 Tax=Peromyscus californicus insignis TaxID=564181 RepID=UPI0022A805BF|nr:UL16-binding protein 1-like [Peromyscus californicus insignis]
MAKNAASEHYPSTKTLCFSVFLTCLWSSLPADAASLCYSFTVGKSGSGPWWQVQGQLNTETFIYCDRNNNYHAIGLLGNRLSAQRPGNHRLGTFIVFMEEENKSLVIPPKRTSSKEARARSEDGKGGTEPLTLQATMHCGHEVNGDIRGFWDFDLNGQKMLHFDSSTGKLTEVDSESSQMKSMLEKNKEVTDFLYRTSQGDCRSWLEQFKSHWEEKLEPTASPIAPDVDLASSMASKHNISVPLIILPYTVFSVGSEENL